MNSLQRNALIVLVVFIALTWIKPQWPVEQGLHNSLTVVGLIYLVWHSRRWPLNNTDFLLIILFMAVHSVAARWLYSYIPYDEWMRAAVSWSPNEAFGWQRNHFDRLVHFLYGICFTGAIAGFFQQWKKSSPRFSLFIAVLLIVSSSVAYEWLEWAIALLLSPDAAEAYNGQQGDVWDAHKDMLLATLGSAIWIFAPRFRAYRTIA
jgi:putative membrane protein